MASATCFSAIYSPSWIALIDNSMSGLSEKDAFQRLKNEGYNELPSAKSRNFPRTIAEVVQEPMFLLLIAGGVIYFVLGDVQEAIMLSSFVFVIIGITVYQHQKTEKALEALKNLSSPRALVVRDGQRKRIPGREVVRGDVLLLSEGDRVPADGLLLSSNNLMIDESLLTGESVPVRKVSWDGRESNFRPGGDDVPVVFSGTLVTQGQAVEEVRATGIRTEMGKIGKTLQAFGREETPLMRDVKHLVRNVALVALLLCAVVVAVYGLVRLEWLNGFLAGITLGMAILPEEFPVVLTIFLALGAWRLSRSNVLTRRAPVIETLGSATVLCVDKTGTLTENRMSVSAFLVGQEMYDVGSTAMLPESFHQLTEFSILACKQDPFDPMEKALMDLGGRLLSDTGHLHKDWTLVQEYPLSKELRAMSNVWKSKDGAEHVIASKGAPESIADLCHFDDQKMRELSQSVDQMAKRGLRVLGVAKAEFESPQLPESQHDIPFHFLGLVGFADPVRSKVPNAINECYDAGIRVIMITGDYPATAQNIAQQIGLKSSDKCITGTELDKLTDNELQQQIKVVNVFARITPEQKLRIVNALKRNGEIVAMTGDGVNDAPALKSAHIGIAMGGRGTDVAREAASIVLLDDNFTSIVAGVRMGRRIFDNLKKAVAYIFSIHIPIAGTSLVPLLFGWPLILMPIHIVFLELVIDPACSIVFEAEPEEKGVMQRPPRRASQLLFDKKMVGVSLLQGGIILIMLLIIFLGVLSRGFGEFEARTLAFITIVSSNLGLILTNRSWSQTILKRLHTPNKALWWVFGGTLLFLILALAVPALRNLFRFSPFHPIDLATGFGVGAVSVLWFEILKVWNQHRRGQLL